jgi:deoxyribose-phosphate aldolase
MHHTSDTSAGAVPPPPQTPAELAAFIDHTLLRADATEDDITNLCEEAFRHRFYAVCVNSGHVAYAAKALEQIAVNHKHDSRVRIAAVVGFPLGACTTSTKVFEAQECIRLGAEEIDMVVRLDFVKTGEFDRVSEDIASVVQSVTKLKPRGIVKVILETGLLTHEQIARATRAADEAGAHFIKTCTGFSTAGAPAGAATVEHVALMRESARSHVKIKASGGIRTFEMARNLIIAGADRLGTSSGVSLVSAGASQGTGY